MAQGNLAQKSLLIIFLFFSFLLLLLIFNSPLGFCTVRLTMAEANDDKPNDKPGEGNPGDGGGKPAGDKPAGGGGGGEAAKTYTQAELDAALAADRQTRSKAAKAKAGKAKDEAGDDDAQSKDRQRLEQLEGELRTRDARDSVEKAAKDAGFQNPGKIYRLVKDDLSFDDGGKPENVKDLITIAKRDFPEELGTGKGKGSIDAGERGVGKVGGGGMNSLIRRAAGYQD